MDLPKTFSVLTIQRATRVTLNKEIQKEGLCFIQLKERPEDRPERKKERKKKKTGKITIKIIDSWRMLQDTGTQEHNLLILGITPQKITLRGKLFCFISVGSLCRFIFCVASKTACLITDQAFWRNKQSNLKHITAEIIISLLMHIFKQCGRPTLHPATIPSPPAHTMLVLTAMPHQSDWEQVAWSATGIKACCSLSAMGPPAKTHRQSLLPSYT